MAVHLYLFKNVPLASTSVWLSPAHTSALATRFDSMQLHLPCVITPALPGQDTDKLCCGARCQAFMKVLHN